MIYTLGFGREGLGFGCTKGRSGDHLALAEICLKVYGRVAAAGVS